MEVEGRVGRGVNEAAWEGGGGGRGGGPNHCIFRHVGDDGDEFYLCQTVRGRSQLDLLLLPVATAATATATPTAA